MQTTQDLSSYVNLSELAQDDESMMEFYLVTTDEADKELSPILQIAHKVRRRRSSKDPVDYKINFLGTT